MLARRNRITRGFEYRATVRSGRRVRCRHIVASVVPLPAGSTTRFGFIVSRAVGGAVTRNRVRRRLKAICRQRLLPQLPPSDIVIRALPASAEVPWDTLVEETVRAVRKGLPSL